jgi:K+/H+ antiporter YhaU regulatory subunit KhtT
MSDEKSMPENESDDNEEIGSIVHEDDRRVYFYFKADDEDAIDQIVAAWKKKFGKRKS